MDLEAEAAAVDSAVLAVAALAVVAQAEAGSTKVNTATTSP